MGRVLFLTLLPLIAAPWAAASGDSPSRDEEVIELRINGQDAGTTLLVRRDADGALLIRAEDFSDLRLKPPQQPTVLVDGVAYFRVDAGDGCRGELRARDTER